MPLHIINNFNFKEGLIIMTGLIPFTNRGVDFDSLFGGLGGFSPFDNRITVSNYTVEEVENGVKINFDMPGVRADDVSVNFNNGVLSVSGERREVKEVKNDDGEVTSKMVNTATYSNNFKLSDRFNVEKLDAVIEHGVLSITIPLSEKAKPRSITVRSGEGELSEPDAPSSNGEAEESTKVNFTESDSSSVDATDGEAK